MSKGINHLLKSPLCVHPKTGRICVPIDTKKLNQFNPFDVPTISQICYELDKVKPEHGETKHKQGMKYFSLHHLSLPPLSLTLTSSPFSISHLCTVYMKTSLRPYMDVFNRQFLYPLIQDNNRQRAKGQSKHLIIPFTYTMYSLLPVCNCRGIT